jgi:hypothetical protein
LSAALAALCPWGHRLSVLPEPDPCHACRELTTPWGQAVSVLWDALEERGLTRAPAVPWESWCRGEVARVALLEEGLLRQLARKALAVRAHRHIPALLEMDGGRLILYVRGPQGDDRQDIGLPGTTQVADWVGGDPLRAAAVEDMLAQHVPTGEPWESEVLPDALAWRAFLAAAGAWGGEHPCWLLEQPWPSREGLRALLRRPGWASGPLSVPLWVGAAAPVATLEYGQGRSVARLAFLPEGGARVVCTAISSFLPGPEGSPHRQPRRGRGRLALGAGAGPRRDRRSPSAVSRPRPPFRTRGARCGNMGRACPLPEIAVRRCSCPSGGFVLRDTGLTLRGLPVVVRDFEEDDGWNLHVQGVHFSHLEIEPDTGRAAGETEARYNFVWVFEDGRRATALVGLTEAQRDAWRDKYGQGPEGGRWTREVRVWKEQDGTHRGLVVPSWGGSEPYPELFALTEQEAKAVLEVMRVETERRQAERRGPHPAAPRPELGLEAMAEHLIEQACWDAEGSVEIAKQRALAAKPTDGEPSCSLDYLVKAGAYWKLALQRAFDLDVPAATAKPADELLRFQASILALLSQPKGEG